MIRRLIIMRHAKSSGSSGSPTDHDRPLNDEGMEQAPQTADKLVKLNWLPSQILCSDAQRTRETWEFMAPVFGDVDIEVTRDLYEADPSDVLALIASQSDSIGTLMIIGHNPYAESLVEWLCGDFVELKPANAALLEGKIASWSDILKQKAKWQLTKIASPNT